MPAINSFASLVNFLLSLANPAVAVLTAVALVIFFWGILRYVFSLGGTGEKAEGREMIVWGIVALVVLISLWGIVGLVANTFLGSALNSGSSYNSGSTSGSNSTSGYGTLTNSSSDSSSNSFFGNSQPASQGSTNIYTNGNTSSDFGWSTIF